MSTNKSPRKDLKEESSTSKEFSEVQDKPLLGKPTPSGSPAQTKLTKNFFERTRTTIYMLVGYVLVLSLGHFYISLLVMFLIFKMYQQVSAIKRYYEKQNQIPITPLLTWYILIITVYYIVGRLFLVKMPVMVLEHTLLMSLLKYHNFISFLLWISALLIFVLSLQKGYMKYQFRVFGWTCIAMLLIVVPGGGMLFNLYQGLCWFILPTLLIICNDIFAYLVGYFFGKRQLISLSPKKTWEGYIGGAVITFFASLLLVAIINEFPTLLCPQTELTMIPFAHPTCDSFLLNKVQLNFGIFSISLQKIQIHAFVLSAFASIVGPFGGFFASGLKRSIKIKDWADTIPGHGGVTDRMDCQLLMGLFTFFYLHNIVLEDRANFSLFLKHFTTDQQILLLNELKMILRHQGVPV